MKFAPATSSSALRNERCRRRGDEAEGGVGFREGFRLVAPAAVSTRKVRRCSGFTLIEVLAAMLFMAIVIPVAVEALHISSLSGEFAVRKAEAARVADRILNENLASTNGFSSAFEGSVIENGHQFRWKVETEPWSQDSEMELMTAEVTFSAGGRQCAVRLTTLANPNVNLQSAGAVTSGGQ